MDWMSGKGKGTAGNIFRILAGVALGLQAAAVALSVYICVDQQRMKQMFSSYSEILEVYSVPVDYLVMNFVPALLYVVFFVFLLVSAEGVGRRIGAGIFFGIGCFLKIVLEYLPQFSSIFWYPLNRASMDTAQMASYMTLGSAITMASRPLSVTAFGFFCLAAGGILGAGWKGRTVAPYK